jgi:hypothetical protein
MKNPIYPLLALLFLTIGMMAQSISANKKQSQSEDKKNATAIENQMKTKFYEKAKQANLTQEKTEELVGLIEERNKVLKDLNAKKNNADLSFSIQDPVTMLNNKITDAQNQYAQKILKALTYEEFSHFVRDDYDQEAAESAKVEFFKLIQKKPDLTKGQKVKIIELFYNYHLNQLLYNDYLRFDTSLQMPKLKALKFTFEKELAKICKEYGINFTAPTGTNSNDFQWK